MFSVLEEIKKDALDRRALSVTITVALFSGLIFGGIFNLFGLNVGSILLSTILMFAISWGNHVFLRQVESKEKVPVAQENHVTPNM